jgi:putative transposase
MSNYRRARVAGATYFFTVNLHERSSDSLVREIELLRATVRATKAPHPFYIYAWVVLPEHMHCLWTLPEGDADFALRWQVIKFAFAKRAPLTEPVSCLLKAWGERGIWQRRYWEHLIRDERDYRHHFDCSHFNPKKTAMSSTSWTGHIQISSRGARQHLRARVVCQCRRAKQSIALSLRQRCLAMHQSILGCFQHTRGHLQK